MARLMSMVMRAAITLPRFSHTRHVVRVGVPAARWMSQTTDGDDEYRALPSSVLKGARALDSALSGAKIPFVIVGAVALNAHGYRRATEDVDILVNQEDLFTLGNTISGRGWLPRYRGASRKFRDTVNNVDVDVLISGEYPGDGLPKAVAFPRVGCKLNEVPPMEVGGLHVLRLVQLVQLKLASGTAPNRRKDLADVQALIVANQLPREFVDELDVSVKQQFVQLWDEVDEARKKGLPT